MGTKKLISKIESSNAINGIAPPPAAGAPQPPTDFVPKKRGRGAGPHVSGVEVKAAPTAAQELVASPTAYLDDFGAKAPSAATVAEALTLAAAWFHVARDAGAWAAYAQEQSDKAWEVTRGYLKAFKPAFEYAAQRDATVAQRYPSTAQLVEAPGLVAKRAAATRKAKKKEKEKAAKAAPAPAPAPEPASTPDATS